MDRSATYKSYDITPNMEVKEGKRQTGCYVSIVAGFVLTLLACCLAVGVGIIVHFAEFGETVDCKCTFPSSSPALGTPVTPTQKPIQEQCADLIINGNQQLCNLCAFSKPTSTPKADATTSVSEETTPPTSKRNVRLQLDMYPIFYDVELQPHMYSGDPNDFFFQGSVRIEMICRFSTNEIVLHSNKLNISSVALSLVGGLDQPWSPTSEFDIENHFLILKSNQTLVAGKTYSVTITFRGLLTDDLAGLYLSSYQRGGNTVYIATSQMQPTEARKTFPCFDEPAIKAQFNITLVRKSHMVTLGNTPIAFSENRGNDWVADHFTTTPKMSTYLLATIVCDFNYTKQITKNNIEYRAWARPDAVDQTPYSLSVGVDILTYFEEYFNIPFPLPKQDMIAVPDFVNGAMENWGLIVYKETSMLYDPMESAESNKQFVAEVISHELGHQWFGNLVSPSWWDDLWLNEGFATFLQYTGVDHIHPEWKMFEQFAFAAIHTAFKSDALVTSHPVYVPVSNPDQIYEIFDGISYFKGAAIIRMMQFFLGEETFRRGLVRYLNEKAYDTAFHDDLWYAMGNQSIFDGKPQRVHDVKSIMNSWILQMNYPVVTMTREGDNIRLKQSRFLADRTTIDPGTYTSSFGYKWEIPVTFTTNKQRKFNQTAADIYWLGVDGAELILSGALSGTVSSDWYIGNMLQYGFYRVNYPEENWYRLIEQLKVNHTVIHPMNRAQIINDAWNFAKSGYITMDIALRTLEYLSNEESFTPIFAATDELAYVDKMLEKTSLYGKFSKFMKTTFSKSYSKLGINSKGMTHLESYVQTIAVTQACKYGNSDCIGNVTQLFRSWMLSNNSKNPIDVNLRSAVYCTSIQHGGVEEWDFAYQQYKMTNVVSEKETILAALACSNDVWILSRFIEYTFKAEEIRKQDAVPTLGYISSNPIGRLLAWDFVRSNWDAVLREFDGILFPLLISVVTKSFNTEFELQMINAFVSGLSDLGSAARTFDQAIEETSNNIKWMQKNYASIQSWLNSM